MANIDLQAADYAAANRYLTKALQAFRELGHQRGVARQLESLSWCASRQSRDEKAVAWKVLIRSLDDQITQIDAVLEVTREERMSRAG